MSIYRRKLRSGKRSRYFTAEFEYRGKVYRQSGLPDRDSAKHWIAEQTLKLRRGAIGYVKPMLAAQVAPLIESFTKHLRDRGRDSMYCYTSGMRLKRLAGDCGWITLGHVTRDGLRDWLGAEQKSRAGSNRGKAITNRTKNQYLDTAQEWGKWLASQDVNKLQASPFAGMNRLTAKHNNAYRRAATVEELNKLLATCSPGNRLYYLFRIYTPMRAATIGKLTWKMLHLDAAPPFAKTPAEINKSRHEEKHTIRYDVAQELRSSRKGGQAPLSLVFPKAPTLDDLRHDLAVAGVAFEDEQGNRRLDFHALRRTLIKLAKASGLTLDKASLLLGHKSMETTRRYYDEDQVAPELGESMERLPELGKIRRAE